MVLIDTKSSGIRIGKGKEKKHFYFVHAEKIRRHNNFQLEKLIRGQTEQPSPAESKNDL